MNTLLLRELTQHCACCIRRPIMPNHPRILSSCYEILQQVFKFPKSSNYGKVVTTLEFHLPEELTIIKLLTYPQKSENFVYEVICLFFALMNYTQSSEWRWRE